ncbi:MAG: hypothetical protein M3Y07_05590 [Acidobacteriota bacterium]|nr:hypothetical protein [Acidobacteriota bacterium]
MKTREIVLDEESDQLLESLAAEYAGDVNSAIRDLLSMPNALESDLDGVEERNSEELHRQKERSERDFLEGNIVNWSDLKLRRGL